jgi:hypothetical protein
MASRHQVSCINKRIHGDPHERIENIGGVSDGKQWKLSEDEAISGIESGKWAFYVSVGGRSVDVVVAAHKGRKYLKTVADGYAPDNLLSLPECP